jgi:hypothetical protein
VKTGVIDIASFLPYVPILKMRIPLSAEKVKKDVIMDVIQSRENDDSDYKLG